MDTELPEVYRIRGHGDVSATCAFRSRLKATNDWPKNKHFETDARCGFLLAFLRRLYGKLALGVNGFIVFINTAYSVFDLSIVWFRT